MLHHGHAERLAAGLSEKRFAGAGRADEQDRRRLKRFFGHHGKTRRTHEHADGSLEIGRDLGKTLETADQFWRTDEEISGGSSRIHDYFVKIPGSISIRRRLSEQIGILAASHEPGEFVRDVVQVVDF
jgi:hypothetical protein